MPLMEDPGQPWKQAVFSRYHSGDSVRTDRYLYAEGSNDEGRMTARMLYGHKQDAAENVNLSEKPENAARVASLSKTLHDGWQAALP